MPLAEIKTVSDLVRLCKSVPLYGELVTLIELSKHHKDLKWKGGARFSYDIECDGKKIEVKSSNVDNEWAQKEREKDPSFQSGFDNINPDKFDYLVCVSFRQTFTEPKPKFYVFTKDEVKLFDKARWKRVPNAFMIEIRNYSDEKRNKAIKESKDAWHKIAQTIFVS